MYDLSFGALGLISRVFALQKMLEAHGWIRMPLPRSRFVHYSAGKGAYWCLEFCDATNKTRRFSLNKTSSQCTQKRTSASHSSKSKEVLDEQGIEPWAFRIQK